MLARTRLSGEWSEDDYDVLADGIAVGRIFRAAASPEGSRWMWPLAFGHHGDRTPTHGYAATREAAMAEFAKSWRRGHGLAVSSPQAVIPFTRLADRPLVTDRAMEAWYHPSIA